MVFAPRFRAVRAVDPCRRQTGYAYFLDTLPVLDFETFEDHFGCSSQAIRYNSLSPWSATRLSAALVDCASSFSLSSTRFRTPNPTISLNWSALGSIRTASASRLEPA